MSVIADRLLAEAKKLAADGPGGGGETRMVFVVRLITLVETLRGPNHPMTRTLHEIMESMAKNQIEAMKATHAVAGISKALVADLEAGLIPDLESRVRSEVEGDLLAQAARLLDDGLKDPAAMLIGAVLEDALRQLSRKRGLPDGNSIEAMNEPLRQSGLYGLPQKQQVTAWAAIRNKADHGRFSDYTLPEVRLMHQGVAGFVAAHLGR
jgi:hypothetical protein